MGSENNTGNHIKTSSHALNQRRALENRVNNAKGLAQKKQVLSNIYSSITEQKGDFYRLLYSNSLGMLQSIGEWFAHECAINQEQDMATKTIQYLNGLTQGYFEQIQSEIRKGDVNTSKRFSSKPKPSSYEGTNPIFETNEEIINGIDPRFVPDEYKHLLDQKPTNTNSLRSKIRFPELEETIDTSEIIEQTHLLDRKPDETRRYNHRGPLVFAFR
jgi:hypothetical protein